jgi:hypothetical protein
MTDTIKYDGAIYIRANAGTIAEIKACARRRGTKTSTWVRDALTLVLQLERGAAERE